MKTKLYFATLICALGLPLFTACSDDDEVFGTPDIRQPLPREVGVTGKVVTDAGAPLADVVVSDGINLTTTDAEGNFVLQSEMELGYIFVSTPSGYEPTVSLDGNRPCFWKQIDRLNSTDITFTLKPIASKGPLSIVAIADPQISNREGDVELLKNFYVPEINKTIDALRAKGTDPIVITLGDIICDWFLANGFGYTLDMFNKDFQVNAPVYHTMGNHDNDPFTSGDFETTGLWRNFNGPTYYSFNRGGAHFIVVDNIVYTNPGASHGVSGKRSYTTALTEEQLNWIAADLATIKDKTAPLFITMHGIFLTYPVADGQTISKVYRFDDGGPQLGALLADFTNVKVMSGHAHKNHFQHTPEGNIREYNYAGTNGGWWPAGFKPYKANLPVCFDGAPWGMGIWDFTADAKNPTHIFKGYNLDENEQIRVYDLNTTIIDNTDFTKAFVTGASKNNILANVWAYEPGCTVKMFENGKELQVRRVALPDPYLIIKYLLPIKEEYGSWNSGMDPEHTAHMFRANATTADAPVTVEFTDLWGRKFTKTLNRPGTLE